ncbi:MAG: methylmalonyl Co-A mutase-associated GTPase MeaB [Candidatus Kapabacteria bacterium]|jgi:LAO/AO transport system kinase|nr:methylmalonyl Co-A mutase-associated GTPase MeaB [Candidatus Kapabacteria bacterium]
MTKDKKSKIQYTDKRPDWVPENAGDEFAARVMIGVESGNPAIPGQTSEHQAPHSAAKNKLSVDDHVEGVLKDDRGILAQSITLVESNSLKHIEKAQEVIKKILPHTGKSIRVGITGVPGVGKSTFIEVLGTDLCKKGHKVAVLAIDPSSAKTRGSILGDKTRMELLSREKNSFIRPSPSGGTLGGVTRKTRETIMLCEAAGFDVILIETVGVGQSEISVRSMVDFFMLLMLPGGGDELQGIKKGIMEMSDLLVINKAEEDNFAIVTSTLQNYKMALHYIQSATEGWTTEVLKTSALNSVGIEEVWAKVLEFIETTKKSGIHEQRRKDQVVEWVMSMVENELLQKFYNEPAVAALLPGIKENVRSGKTPPTKAVREILEKFL